MKKQFVLGMVLVTFLAAPVFAAVEVEVGSKIEETMKKVNTDVFGKANGATGLARTSQTMAEDKMFRELGVGGNDLMNIRKSLTGKPAAVEARLNSLATLVAARRIIPSLPADVGSSLNETTEALIQTLASADMSGMYESKAMDQQTREMVTEVNRKLESPDMVKKTLGMKKAAREEWTAFLKERSRLLTEVRPTPSGEDASLQALMNLKKLSKEAAIEKLRQMKECV